MRHRMIVRQPGDSFRDAIAGPGAARPDPALARAQHAELRGALLAAGAEVVALEADERYPDACFVEDVALVLDGRALLLRPGAVSRRGEVEAIEPHLRPLVRSLDRVDAPATVDGGDIMRLGDRLVVGRSRRTNDAGIEAVEAFAGDLDVEVIDVPEGILHLQTAATPVAGSMVGLEEVVSDPVFDGWDRIVVPRERLPACNVLGLGRDAVMAEGHPDVRAALQERGVRVHEVGLSEFVKASGGPTCLTLRT